MLWKRDQMIHLRLRYATHLQCLVIIPLLRILKQRSLSCLAGCGPCRIKPTVGAGRSISTSFGKAHLYGHFEYRVQLSCCCDGFSFCHLDETMYVCGLTADIPLPCQKAREDLFALSMKGVPLAEDADLGKLAELSEV
jgi:hypothetical protein